MFHRGSRIVITESSATKRAHPAVGDRGYVNGMYLFFLDRFILLDGFFFSYASDKKKATNRCERKRFLLDLGMTEPLKRKISKYGLPKRYFTRNPNVANLTLAAHTYSPMNYANHSEYPENYSEYPDVNSLWYINYDREGKIRDSSAIKIPFGSIALDTNRRHIGSEGSGELRAWIECMIPLVESVLLSFPHTHMTLNTASIYSYADRAIKTLDGKFTKYGTCRGLDYLRTLPELRNRSTDRLHGMVAALRVLQSASQFLLKNCDTTALLKYAGSVPTFITYWRIGGLRKAILNKSTNSSTIKFLTGLVFRSFLASQNARTGLSQLMEFGMAPFKSFDDATIERIENAKKEANLNSAALNRVLKEFQLN